MANGTRKNTKSNTRRNRYNKRYRKYYKRKASLNVIPKSLIKKFRYVQDVSIDPNGQGAMATWIFRANSMYDPDYSSSLNANGEHQPYGYDQYVPTLYNHVTVLASKITCVFSLGNPGISSAANNLIVGISLKDDSTAQTNPSLVREQGGYCTWSMITNAMAPKTKRLTYSAKKFHGVKDVKDNKQLAHPYNNNPEEEAYFHVWAAACASNVDAFNTTVQIVIEYISLLQEPNTFGAS